MCPHCYVSFIYKFLGLLQVRVLDTVVYSMAPAPLISISESVIFCNHPTIDRESKMKMKQYMFLYIHMVVYSAYLLYTVLKQT